MPILVVDDSTTTRRYVRQELERGGFDVLEAGAAEEAFAQVAQGRPDLITLGVEMPGMDGFEFCARLRSGAGGNEKLSAYASNIPVVFLTAADSIEKRERGFESGATEFIAKPFRDGELVQVVKRILSSEQTLKSTMALVVDDSAVVRQVVGQTLSGLGVEVLEAEDGVQALEVLRANQDAVDLVVTDLMMPKMNGDQLCREIRSDPRYQDLPVIMLSGHDERAGILDLFRAGVTDFVLKPCPMEELVARISVHLRARKLNRELAQNVEELKKIRQMQDQFLAITSHDLRSPLTGILGFSQLLLANAVEPEMQKDFLTRIRSAGLYLLDLINDLLDLNQIQAGDQSLEMESVSILEIAQNSLENLGFMAKSKNISTKLDNLLENPPILMGNANALLRVVNNLVSNAIKFTETDGEVVVRVENGEGPTLLLKIIDTGIGIPEEQIPKLFEAYSKVSQAGTAGEKGTGLGMSITKQLVGRHGGSIAVESRMGEGTTFTVSLPLQGV